MSYSFKFIWLSLLVFTLLSCNEDEDPPVNAVANDPVARPDIESDLPKRPGPVPQTTTKVPHVQIGVELVPEVHAEMISRIYSIPGVEDRNSVIGSWRGMWIAEHLEIVAPLAVIEGREFAHIHDDGSLHIFLEPSRANEAVHTCWGAHHPFAVSGMEEWQGFIMLYTPQSMEELDVAFQLIVDGFNHVTGQELVASDYF